MLQPKGNRLLVKPTNRIPPGQLVIISDGEFCLGEVVAAGEGKRDKHHNLIPMSVKVGDTVAFGDYHKDYFKFTRYYEDHGDGTASEYLLLSEMDITGVVEQAPNAC